MLIVVIIYILLMMLLQLVTFRQMPGPDYFWIGICLIASAGIIGSKHGSK